MNLADKLRRVANGDVRETARDLTFEAKDALEWAGLMDEAADEIERLRAALFSVVECIAPIRPESRTTQEKRAIAVAHDALNSVGQMNNGE